MHKIKEDQLILVQKKDLEENKNLIGVFCKVMGEYDNSRVLHLQTLYRCNVTNLEKNLKNKHTA